MKLTRREYVAGMASLLGACNYNSAGGLLSASPPAPPTANMNGGAGKRSGSTAEAPLRTFTPELFGARGDGVTNDTAAFARMCDEVNRFGGGTVVLRPTTYIVGMQDPDNSGLWAYAPAPIMDFNGCRNDLTIVGNGARLRCADGLRYGTFDPLTGSPTNNPMPFYGYGQRASPYDSMLLIRNCTGKIYIKKLELDGNISRLAVGGPYGDTGWQIPACGLRLLNNVGGEEIVAVYSHHHAQDGVYLDGPTGRATSTSLQNVISTYNGRQGASIVGGCNYTFVDCNFSHTGRAGLVSAPGAGVDIEAETNPIRNLNFANCYFMNNAGAGMVADSGDSDGATFDGCTFVGTTTWSAWPAKPHFRFSNCKFVGSICHAFFDPDPARAAQFSNCSFVDDPSLSPTGEVYGFAIADLGAGDTNVLFDSCTFDLKKNAVLPWTVSAIYRNCTMSQLCKGQAYPRGTFTGVSTVVGNVDISSSKVIGTLILNGQLIAPTDHFGW